MLLAGAGTAGVGIAYTVRLMRMAPRLRMAPYLNLSQAVLLYCYEFFRRHGRGLPSLPARDYATHRELEGMYGHMRSTLQENNFFDVENPDHLMEYIRRLFGRVQMSKREVNIIRGIMHLVDKLKRKSEGTQ
jgi:tRNA/rRNA methyltransferase